MANITKLEQSQIINRLTAEAMALRLQVSQLQADLQRVTEVASAVNSMQRPERSAYVMPQWQKDRAAAMAAAKATALATRSTVRV